MSGNSTFSTFLLAALLLAATAGLYFVIDSHSLAIQRADRVEKTLTRIADRVERVDSRLQSLAAMPAPVGAAFPGSAAAPAPVPLGAPVAAAEGEIAVVAGQNGTPLFAEDDLRDPDADDGDSRVGYTTSLTGQLNYIIHNEAMAGVIWELCHAPLAKRNAKDVDRFEPVMAESWTRSADGLVYAIRLRDGFRWQPFTDPETGREWPERPVTAGDFEFFLEVIRNPDVPCDFLRSYYEFLENIEALDDRTLRVTWREPYSLAESITLSLTPLARHLYRPPDEAELDDKTWAERYIASPRNQIVVGVGPYRLVHFDAARGFRLERDENYGGRKPHLKVRETRLIGDPEIALVEFKNRRLDAIGLEPVQWSDQTPSPDFLVVTPDAGTAAADSAAFDEAKRGGTAPDKHKFEKYQYPSLAWFYIGYNLRRPLFSDKRVRRALTLLVDRERILRDVYLGLGQIITGPFLPQNPAYDPAVAPWPYDPGAARQLLADAGWADGDGDGVLDKEIGGKRTPFRFTFIVPSGSSTLRRIAAIVEQDFQSAGLAMDIKPLEWSVYTQILNDWDFDVCTLAWTGELDTDPYQLWHSSQADVKGGSNHVGYKSDEADRLIEEGRRTLDAAKRNEIYHRFHRLLHEDLPYTFLIAPTSTIALDKRYRNLRVYPLGMDPDLHWVPAARQKPTR